MIKTLQKKFEYKYGHFHFKSAFGTNFGLREVAKLKLSHLRRLAHSPPQSPSVASAISGGGGDGGGGDGGGSGGVSGRGGGSGGSGGASGIVK